MNTEHPTTTRTAPLTWRGIHHLAVITPDLDATRKFYGEVLGMEVGEALTLGGRGGQHCFIKPGECEGWGLHVFEHAGAQVFAAQEPTGLPYVRAVLQHIAFALPDAAAAEVLRERLRAHGMEPTPTGLPGPMASMIFYDNLGSMLEAIWPRGEELP
jgi:catechol 2,3-dioxygenase-like lactoylglutathione lyase family enzyme